jgi:hypothetical protein
LSHTATIKTEVRDVGALRAACRRLNLPDPVFRQHRLFGSNTATGYGVQLPEWRYIAVFDVESGEAYTDPYGTPYEKRGGLDRFLQAYGVEKCKAEARRAGHTAIEQALPDGSVRLTIQLGSA